MGIEPGRLHFSWISSAEGTRFAEVANKVIKAVQDLGPNEHFSKNLATKTLSYKKSKAA
jgi:coenzyme F420-reducing hydrogenase delta subunit